MRSVCNSWATCFQMAVGSHIRIWVMLDHQRSTIVGLSLVLKFGLDPIFGNIAIFISCCFGLKLPIHANFGRFGGIFPPNMVTYRSNPHKDHSCAETRRSSHKVWKSVQRFDQGTGSRKKGKGRTGQLKKSQGGNISPILGEATTAPIETKIARWVISLT